MLLIETCFCYSKIIKNTWLGRQIVSTWGSVINSDSTTIIATSLYKSFGLNPGWIEIFLAALSWCSYCSLTLSVSHSPHLTFILDASPACLHKLEETIRKSWGFNPDWHKGGLFYLLVLFGLDLFSWPCFLGNLRQNQLYRVACTFPKLWF